MKILGFAASAAALSIAGLLAAAPASAQGVTLPANPKCEGKVFVDSIYQNGLGGNRYEYFIQLRNQSGSAINWSMAIGGFSSATVTLEKSNWSGRLGANSSTTIKFGSGTDGNVNRGTVGVLYDSESAIGNPHVNVKGCY